MLTNNSGDNLYNILDTFSADEYLNKTLILLDDSFENTLPNILELNLFKAFGDNLYNNL